VRAVILLASGNGEIVTTRDLDGDPDSLNGFNLSNPPRASIFLAINSSAVCEKEKKPWRLTRIRAIKAWRIEHAPSREELLGSGEHDDATYFEVKALVKQLVTGNFPSIRFSIAEDSQFVRFKFAMRNCHRPHAAFAMIFLAFLAAACGLTSSICFSGFPLEAPCKAA